jgi:hypothetical protein
MITADNVKYFTSLPCKHLESILMNSGYFGCSFEKSKFVGITSGGQFCYAVEFFDKDGTGEIEKSKVFVTYHPSNDKVTADF